MTTLALVPCLPADSSTAWLTKGFLGSSGIRHDEGYTGTVPPRRRRKDGSKTLKEEVEWLDSQRTIIERRMVRRVEPSSTS